MFSDGSIRKIHLARLGLAQMFEFLNTTLQRVQVFEHFSKYAEELIRRDVDGVSDGSGQ